MTTRLAAYLLAAVAALALILVGLSLFGPHQEGQAHEIQSAIHTGEANTHVSQAQAISDHAAELQSAKDDVARARAEVARVKRILAAQPQHAVPDPAGEGSAMPPSVDPDPRDQVIASQGVLIEKLTVQVGGLELALSDEKRRSTEYREAFEAERRASQAQAAATEAWKKAVTSSKWVGRAQGFAAGVALGYVGGRR